MKKVVLLGFLVFALGLFACAETKQSAAYRSDVWNGKKLLDDGDYKQALDNFVRAAKTMPTEPQPYAFAAAGSYKLDDIEGASRYIQEAARLDKTGDARMRILGYKALILLKQGKEKEGLQALGDYVAAYQNEYGPQNVRPVRNMLRSGRVDLPALQRLLDEEITIYESDMEQYRRSGTGWFATRSGSPQAAAGGQ